MRRVAIVGVGLIGGSLGLALRKHGFTGTITGVGRRETLEKARAGGVIDEAQEQLEDGIRAADLVFLATPIATILDLLPRIQAAAAPQALITDAGSTKARIADRALEVFGEPGAASPLFICGHPMAGSEKRGVLHASADLFQAATWILTPSRREHLDASVAVEFRRWIELIGARPLVMDAELHDEIVAFTSHLPQLVATALASVVLERAGDDNLRLAGGGLRDTTRLAESPYSVWRDICLTNSSNIEAALDAMIERLEELRGHLRTRELQHEFEAGLRLREKLQEAQGV